MQPAKRQKTNGAPSSADVADISNPCPQRAPPPLIDEVGHVGDKFVVVMVGLPARGKTSTSRRLARYLSFFHGAETRIFNAAEYRYRSFGTQSHKFYDESEQDSVQKRMQCVQDAMNDMKAFLIEGADPSTSSSPSNSKGRPSTSAESKVRIGFFDATNVTKERRQWTVQQLNGSGCKVIFVESIVHDQRIVRNIIMGHVGHDPAYKAMSEQEAVADLEAKIKEYKKVYEPLDEESEDHLAWVKLVDGGRRVIVNRVTGFLQARMVQFLSAMHLSPKTYYFSRHGQSQYNQSGKIGGDSPLSEAGVKYAHALSEYAEKTICKDKHGGERPARLWTSSLRRTKMTAQFIKHPIFKLGGEGEEEVDESAWVQMRPRVWKNIDELYAGIMDGMTYEEIAETFPEEFSLRKKDKLAYRYPRGESYLDVIQRLDPVLHEMESYREPLLIVAHQGILRVLLAYFTGLDRSEAPSQSIPLNTVLKLTPRAYGCDVTRELLIEGAPPSQGHFETAIEPPSC